MLHAPHLLPFNIITIFTTSPRLKQVRRQQCEKYVNESVGNSLKEPIILELLEDGIHSSSYLGTFTYIYYAVDKIVENQGYTYIYIGKDKALILPHDRIAPDELNAFVTEVQKRKAAASPPNDTPN